MDLDDDDSFFTRNVLGGNPAPRQPAAPAAQRRASPDPFQSGPDFDVWTANRDSEDTQGETPLQQLIRHWMNERHAPDILPVQQTLLSGLLDHIRRQSDTVQILRSDPSSSEEDHFRIMLVQTEIERVKFIVRSYVRTRLFKIEKYARYITTNADVQSRMSATEQQHATRHATLTDEHFFQSVLRSLPAPQRGLDEAPAFVPSIVTLPDKTRAVFVHARVDCPPVRLPDGTTLEMEKGHISLTPYAVVEQLVARGEVELV
ncbi:hypothetical protein PILCRDRAFT_814459 [Piloderma croceum F 1598]|uniref:DNA replication complex GINS protein SLD5 n=1 Tax=Piloderma croceum (strain F 1598) TaxID=765440 RepID=A0A0C3FTS4_PILCF|nr:hypothetical protein PILCRDRAFT_814459 [Piloderma croceum F 1598]